MYTYIHMYIHINIYLYIHVYVSYIHCTYVNILKCICICIQADRILNRQSLRFMCNKFTYACVYIYDTYVYRYMDMCTKMHICRYNNLDSAPYANKFKLRMYTGSSKFKSVLVCMHMYVYTYMKQMGIEMLHSSKIVNVHVYICTYMYVYIHICTFIFVRQSKLGMLLKSSGSGIKW